MPEPLTVAGSVVSLAFGLATACESLFTQFTLVRHLPQDCRKLLGLVNDVKKVASTAHREGSTALVQYNPHGGQHTDEHLEGWLECLELLHEVVDEVQSVCIKCQEMSLLVRYFSSRELNRSLGLITNRLQLALQCVPIQQHVQLRRDLGQQLDTLRQEMVQQMAAVEQRFDAFEALLLANRADIHLVINMLMTMMQGVAAWEQQQAPGLLGSRKTAQLTPGVAGGDQLLAELTALRQLQLPAERTQDRQALRRTITLVEGMHQQQQQQQQPRRGALHLDMSDLQQYLPGNNSRSPSPYGPHTPALVPDPPLASYGRNYSFGSTTSSSRGSRGRSSYASTSRDAPAAPSAPLLPLGSSNTRATVSLGLASDVQSLLHTAMLLPDSQDDWRALGQALAHRLGPHQRVDLSGLGLEDAHMLSLVKCCAPYWPQLQQLDLQGNDITAKGATALAKEAAEHWRHLQELNLVNNNIGDVGVQVLAQHAAPCWPELQLIKLGSNGIGDAGAAAVARAAQHWPGMVGVGLGHNRITSTGAGSFVAVLQDGRWTALQQLDLQGNAVGSSSMEVRQLQRAAQQRCAGGSDAICI